MDETIYETKVILTMDDVPLVSLLYFIWFVKDACCVPVNQFGGVKGYIWIFDCSGRWRHD